MNRTDITPWKVEERELGKKLYGKLQGLALLYPPTDSFRKCISVDTFFKPNQQAFFQVMHFLFRLLDPAECKKRFYWPITDKRGEANFRASTIEYLKFLNEKHNLHWQNIKSYLAVMPGGIKFMKFLLDFVGFVIRELIRQRERQVCSDVESDKITRLSIDRIRHQNEFLKEFSSAFINDIDAQIVKLRVKNDIVKRQMNLIAHTTALDVSQVMDQEFQAKFNNNNQELFQKKFTETTSKITALKEPLIGLKEAIERFQKTAASTKSDEEAVRQSLIKIHKIFALKKIHICEERFLRSCDGNGSDINTLIRIFNCVHSPIEQYLSSVDEKSCSSEFVAAELVSLKDEIQQTKSQITRFQKNLNSNKKKQVTELKNGNCTSIRSETAPSRCTESAVIMKFVSTPPIRMEMIGNHRNVRLPLLGDPNERVDEPSGYFLAVPRSMRKIRHAESSFDPDSTQYKSKIINPMQLLRTVNKSASKTMIPYQHETSALCSKWKERQCIFGNDIRTAIPSTPERRASDGSGETTILAATDSTLIHSPVASMFLNERNRIEQPQTHDNSGGPSFSLKQMFAVKKVQNASLNFQNLSTSPSGRLDPLVSFDFRDVSKQQHSNHSKKPAAVDGKITSSDAPSQLTVNKQWDGKENNPNTSNTQRNLLLDIHPIENEDEIFNTSDGVLKDVTM